jgi:hypothetical protein
MNTTYNYLMLGTPRNAKSLAMIKRFGRTFGEIPWGKWTSYLENILSIEQGI